MKKIIDILITIVFVTVCSVVSSTIFANQYCISDILKFFQHKQLRIAIVTYRGVGEYQACIRMCNTLQKMGYNACVLNEKERAFIFSIFDIDFTINLSSKIKLCENYCNFFIYHIPARENLQRYDGVLSLISASELSKITNYQGNVIPFYFSAHSTEFSDTPKQRLFFCGNLWDPFRSENCLKLYQLLDKTGYFDAYGPHTYWNRLHLKSYKGYIRNENESLLNTMKKAGVSLILHSDDHFKHNITTARIFESLAASNVIISDRLPFIVENFGDSVLYIDRNLPPEKMFEQIDNHMKWILSHQKEAIELARKAHAIFIKKYTLEKILENVINEYYKIKRKKEKLL